MFALLSHRGEAESRRSFLWFGFTALALVALIQPETLRGSNPELSKDARIALIRGLSSEIAVTKIVLPRGKHGISVNDKGVVDKEEAEKELHDNGPAINPGMPVNITRLIFKSNRIIFEINGGGKSGKKWYQHIEIGVGMTTMPISQSPPVLTYGSYISLKLPEQKGEFTVDEAKKLLANTLDFSRHSPTVLYSPAIPPQFKEAIKNHEVIVGMDHDAVLSAKGPPDRKVREDHPDGTSEEDWIYGIPPHVLYVIFMNDVVTHVTQY